MAELAARLNGVDPVIRGIRHESPVLENGNLAGQTPELAPKDDLGRSPLMNMLTVGESEFG